MQEEISEEDLTEALKEMHTYMDITPDDLKKIYALALRHARKKMLSPKAGDIMTCEVISITQDATLDDAINLLTEHHISGMPVVDEKNRVIGVITEADIIAALTGKRKKGLFQLFHKRSDKVPANVKEVMTAPAITVTYRTPAYEIADVFMRKKINRVPVVDEQGILIGIVARADIVRTFEKVVR